MHETLKEYLVKIGWNLDELGLKNAEDKIESVKDMLVNSHNVVISSMSKASLWWYENLSQITKGALKLVDSVATADLHVEEFARKMWTTEQNARSLNNALSALGMSYDDLFYTTDEQYNRFLQLNTLGKQLEAPAELDETLEKIRDIQFEFSKFKLIAQYALRWVGYYLGQYLGEDIDELKNKAQSFNEWLIKNLGKITNEIAKVISKIYRLFKAPIELIIQLGTASKMSFEELSTSGVKALAVLTTAIMAFKTGPVGVFIALIGYILLLIEDFMGWQKGWKSHWDWSGVQDKLFGVGDEAEGMASKIKQLTDNLAEMFDKILGSQEAMNVLEAFLDVVDVALTGINDLLEMLLGNFDKVAEKLPENLRDAFITSGNAAKDFWGVGNDWTLGQSEQYASGLSGYIGGTTNKKIYNTNQTNNVTVNVQTGASANDIASATASAIAKNRIWNNVIS